MTRNSINLSVDHGPRLEAGDLETLGFEIVWHELVADSESDWDETQQDCVELLLNLHGTLRLNMRGRGLVLRPASFTYYKPGPVPMRISCMPGEQHQFVTIRYSVRFFVKRIQDAVSVPAPAMECGIDIKSHIRSRTSGRLPLELICLVNSLRYPPPGFARNIWLEAKVLELAAYVFFRKSSAVPWKSNTQRLHQGWMQHVKMILQTQLMQPPNLRELAAATGCSPYYLSRLFSKEAGMTIQQFTQRLRLERAAEFLYLGECNATEAARKVGYGSLSHFSKAFQEMFGCPPGAYSKSKMRERR